MMVRLEVAPVALAVPSATSFQFHDGAIGRLRNDVMI